MERHQITIPLEILPEASDWKVGQTYRVRLVLKQTGLAEEYASFEVVDAMSLEGSKRSGRYFSTGDGTLKA